ncbi:2-dehydropantoate 2-reductase [Pseudomonas yamanorum]|uniref:2-dehydropantoate 2-reductase n=1 Tax=Pseudomonas yamanorum TaxID=515393 RepID=A0ABU1CQC5_9PSED|nr:2-dehydropantoate 2-reductase [Pseudomonas yamanorum]MDR0189462.1 2-dehydropantoate 2-reductase [Pseudomonas yamanorum]
MRVLVVGAGAIGGYFGGRLLQAGNDITFLVRPGRSKELASNGLRIHSPNGDAFLTRPPTILAEEINETFDVILLSCKAYDLGDAIKSFASAVGPNTSIIPLLNGMKHLDILDEHFGPDRVMGGLCTIHVTLNEKREVVQLQPAQSFIFGDRSGKNPEREDEIEELVRSGNFNGLASGTIMQDMWEKWVFLSSMAASTCLMRTSIGNIVAAPGGSDFMIALIDECKSVAAAYDNFPRAFFVEQKLPLLTSEGSPLTASMFRDIQAGLRVEADNVIGDLIARGEARNVQVPLLRLAYTHLKAYQPKS